MNAQLWIAEQSQTCGNTRRVAQLCVCSREEEEEEGAREEGFAKVSPPQRKRAPAEAGALPHSD